MRGATGAWMMDFTVASSVAGSGRLVMMIVTSAASAFASCAISTPARERPSHNAEPDDTDLSFRHDQPPLALIARTLHGAFHCVQARCGHRLRRGLSRPWIIPYRRQRP